MKKAGLLLVLTLGFNIEVSNGNTTQSSQCKPLCRPVNTCPTSEADWNSRKSVWKCDKGNHTYHCIMTDENILCEVCLKPATIAKGRAGCPRIGCVNGSLELAGVFNCPTSTAGCPNNTEGYMSDHLYKYPACTPEQSTSVVESTTATPTERSSQLSSEQPSTPSVRKTLTSTSIGLIVALCVVVCGISIGALYFGCRQYRRKNRKKKSEAMEMQCLGHQDEEGLALLKGDKMGIVDHNFTKSLYATYVHEDKKWILRCKVSDVNYPCKWYKVVSDGSIQTMNPLEQNEQFRIRQQSNFQILEILNASNFTEVYRCQLPNGVYREFSLDPAKTNIQTVEVGRPCEFVRSMDESSEKCEWYRGEILISSDSRFKQFTRGDDFVLRIKDITNEDLDLSYISKIGNETQIYTPLTSDDTEHEDYSDGLTSHQGPSDEHHFLVTKTHEEDKGHSEDVQFIIPAHVDNIKSLLDKIFKKSDWEKFKTTTNGILTLLKVICAHAIREADQRNWFRCLVRTIIEKCRSTIHSLNMNLVSLRLSFNTFLSKPDPKGNKGSYIQKLRSQLAIFNKGLMKNNVQMEKSIAQIVETIRYLYDKRKSLENAEQSDGSEKCRVLVDKAIESMGFLHTQWQGTKQLLEKLQIAITHLQTVTEHASSADYQTVASTAEQIRVAVQTFERSSDDFESFYSRVDEELVGFLNQCFTVSSEIHEFANDSATSTEYQAVSALGRVEAYSENNSPK